MNEDQVWARPKSHPHLFFEGPSRPPEVSFPPKSDLPKQLVGEALAQDGLLAANVIGEYLRYIPDTAKVTAMRLVRYASPPGHSEQGVSEAEP